MVPLHRVPSGLTQCIVLRFLFQMSSLVFVVNSYEKLNLSDSKFNFNYCETKMKEKCSVKFSNQNLYGDEVIPVLHISATVSHTQ